MQLAKTASRNPYPMTIVTRNAASITVAAKNTTLRNAAPIKAAFLLLLVTKTLRRRHGAMCDRQSMCVLMYHVSYLH